ncbi:MAG: DUF4189 domain-containing protein [Luteibacter sp.]
MKIWNAVLAAVLLSQAGAAAAQCAPGIPSAGNPGCIPPNQQNSPYYQDQDVNAQAAPAQPQPVWQDRWGAIALDGVDIKAGATTGKNTERDAKSGAMEICKNHGGSHCEVVISYYNQCAAVAQRPTGGFTGVASGPTMEKAKDLALQKCGDGTCQVVYSACSVAEQVQ